MSSAKQSRRFVDPSVVSANDSLPATPPDESLHQRSRTWEWLAVDELGKFLGPSSDVSPKTRFLSVVFFDSLTDPQSAVGSVFAKNHYS